MAVEQEEQADIDEEIEEIDAIEETGNEEEEADGQDLENSQDEQEEADTEIENGEDDEDDLEITLDGESPPKDESGEEEPDEKSPNLPSHLRGIIKTKDKALKEKEKELREARKRLEELEKSKQSEPKRVKAPGPKPRLSDADYDEGKLSEMLDNWYSQDAAYKEQEQADAKRQEETQAYWNGVIEKHDEQKKTLSAKANWSEIDATIEEAFDQNKQAILIDGLENAALVKFFLHKNPEHLERLAKMDNLAHFAIQVGKLEAKMKVNHKKAPSTKPESKVEGSNGSNARATQQKLARLRAEAGKTGNFDEVLKFQRQLAGQQK